MVEAYAGLYGLELVAIVEDAGFSAKTLDRPGLQRVLAMLRQGEAEAVVVAKLDRLTRSVRDLGQLLDDHFGAKGQAALLSVSEQIDGRSAGGRMVLNLLATVSQWEREVIGERTRAALQHLKRQHRRTGSIPYGWRLVDAAGKQLEPEPTEQVVVEQARELGRAGNTLQAICDLLHGQGHLSRTGKPFAPSQVARMVA
jgi:DNA invertase Pin-like site-specific DNA recombinase